MCQLLKYYESENTIFLLIDFHKYGSLTPYLRLIRDTIELYPYNLPQLHSLVSLHSSHLIASTTTSHKASMSSSITMVSPNLCTATTSYHRRIRPSHSFSGIPSSLLRSFVQSGRGASPQTPLVVQQTENQSAASDKRRSQSHSQTINLSTIKNEPVDINYLASMMNYGL